MLAGKKNCIAMGRNCIAIGRLVVEPLYCNTRIVLQLGCVVKLENCIAGHQGVLQYRVCSGRKLYCKRRLDSLEKLYCNRGLYCSMGVQWPKIVLQ